MILKAAVFSDLHLRYNRELDFRLELPDDVDVVIVAGDISAPVSESLYWLDENISADGREIVFVAGNHEHYGEVYEESMAEGVAVRGNIRTSTSSRTRPSSSGASASLVRPCGRTSSCSGTRRQP